MIVLHLFMPDTYRGPDIVEQAGLLSLDGDGVDRSSLFSRPLREIVVVSIFVLFVSSLISASIGLSSPWFVLNDDQVLYLYSTTAQVVTSIYGLTLTGFLFFRNELLREAAADETLVEPIEKLKARYFSLLVFVTVLVGAVLLISNLIFSNEAFGSTKVTTILLNMGQVLFVLAFLAIIFFIFEVIAPQRIERASQKLQDELDPSRNTNVRGSLEDFLRNYNRIESILIRFAQPYPFEVKAATIVEPTRDFEKFQKKIPNTRLADFLLRAGKIGPSLHKRLRELITLRNAIIHGAEPVVSQEIVGISVEVLAELKSVFPDNY